MPADREQLPRQGERQAWLGYKDDRLVAIELDGFHAGETVVGWEERGYRVETMSNDEAVKRWRAAYGARGMGPDHAA